MLSALLEAAAFVGFIVLAMVLAGPWEKLVTRANRRANGGAR